GQILLLWAATDCCSGDFMRWRVMPEWLSGDTRRSSCLMLPSADDTTSCPRTSRLRHHGASSLRLPLLLEVYDHPIACFAKFVGEPGVGIEHSEMPIVVTGVHDGKPCLAPRIEAPGRNAAQFVPLGLLAVHAVDLQQHLNGRQHLRCPRPCAAHAAESLG